MSFFEVGGSVARVFEGNIRVGCPGAPGCTMNAFSESDCCALTDVRRNKAQALIETNVCQNFVPQDMMRLHYHRKWPAACPNRIVALASQTGEAYSFTAFGKSQITRRNFMSDINQRLCHTNAVESQVIQPVEDLRSLSRTICFDVKFDDWQPDSLHWNAPSNMEIYSNGTWFIYAAHVANMRRASSLFDQGWYYNFGVTVTFYSRSNSVLHLTECPLIGLNYKEEKWNVSASGHDPRIAEILPDCTHANFSRWMR